MTAEHPVNTSRKSPASTARRRQRHRAGQQAEWIAALWLMLKGYRILAIRARTPAGEIDLVAVRRQRLAFVEVKRRPTLEEAQASVAARQRQRVRNAASLWLTREPRFPALRHRFRPCIHASRALAPSLARRSLTAERPIRRSHPVRILFLIVEAGMRYAE